MTESGIRLLNGGEAERVVVELGFEAEGLYGEVVVFTLGEAGDGDGSDDAGVGDDDGEAAAVGGVVGFGEVVTVAKGDVILLEIEPERVGAAVEAGDDRDLAGDPALVIWRSAGEGAVEELLVGRSEAADVYYDLLIAGDGKLADGEADAPCGVVVEGGEDNFFFLAGDGGDVVCDGHGFKGTGYKD
jgi:hypothetical protein